MMIDVVRETGAQAWHEGKGPADCPYKDIYDGGDYWQSQAGMRQRWFAGFYTSSLCNEIAATWRHRRLVGMT